MPFSEAELRQLLAGGENSRVEFKINPPRAAELAERICGLANSRAGGVILFGVADENGQVMGLTRPQDAADSIIRALRLLRPPLPATEPQAYTLDGATILALVVPPNSGPLHQAGGAFWLRKGTYTVPMTGEEVAEHLHTTGATGWERALCPGAGVDDLDTALVERYFAYRAERSRHHLRHTGRDDLLLGLGCARRDEAGLLRPTNAGVLLFGFDPQLFLPQSEIVCMRYADSLGVGAYVDRKNFSGPLTALIDQAADFLRLHMRVGARIAGFYREDQPEYPLDALREAVVNAIVHRDYSRVGETIRVFYYADRLEVHSPGLLLPGITPADLAALRVPSQPRNPLLAGLLRDLPGYMERIGAGIRLMVHEMRAAGLPAPEFIEQHEFVVLFRNGQPATLPRPGDLNPRQAAGLHIVQAQGSISTGEYVTATGVAERTAFRDLQDLVARGLLVSRGRRRGARYFLP